MRHVTIAGDWRTFLFTSNAFMTFFVVNEIAFRFPNEFSSSVKDEIYDKR